MREQLSLIITLISRGEGHELPRFWQINYPYSNEGVGADYANHITTATSHPPRFLDLPLPLPAVE